MGLVAPGHVGDLPGSGIEPVSPILETLEWSRQILDH